MCGEFGSIINTVVACSFSRLQKPGSGIGLLCHVTLSKRCIVSFLAQCILCNGFAAGERVANERFAEVSTSVSATAFSSCIVCGLKLSHL